MKSKLLFGLVFVLVILLPLVFVPIGCDFTSPQQKFRLAIPKNEYFYNYMAEHFKPFMETKGYQIQIVPAESTIEATSMVADGRADLTLVNNHSTTIAMKLENKAGRLRTVMPLTTRILFAFSKAPLRDSATTNEIFENKKIGIEMLGGETYFTMQRFLSAAKIQGAKFVSYNSDSADVVVFWDRFYGERAVGWEVKGWHPYTFRKNFINFVILNDHALRPFQLPAIPGDEKTLITNTLATDVLLVANQNLGDNAAYLLAQLIFQNKVDLIHNDIMYNSINENFNRETLLFPLHQGTFSYLLRNQPTFFERYAESLALGITILAVIYSAVQGIQGRIRRGLKERIDIYFLEFLEIRSNKNIALEERVKKLDELFQRAVIQMTNEKLDKSDFHILSRLIQQDLTMMQLSQMS